jgi:hypothetical protein
VTITGEKCGLLPVKYCIEQHDGVEHRQETDEADKKYNTAPSQPFRLFAVSHAFKRAAHPFHQARGAVDADDARKKIAQGHDQGHGMAPEAFMLAVRADRDAASISAVGLGNVIGKLAAFLIHAHQVAVGDAEQGAHDLVDDARMGVQQ